ncbi:hypothetical protein QQ045_001379 [Rhodiola kirilowii]
MVPLKPEERRREVLVEESGSGVEESLKEQVEGFVKAWGELIVELGKGCVDILRQNFVTDDCYVVQKLRKPCAKVSGKLRILNEFLPEDRDPVLAWPVVLFVFILALSVSFYAQVSFKPAKNGINIGFQCIAKHWVAGWTTISTCEQWAKDQWFEEFKALATWDEKHSCKIAFIKLSKLLSFSLLDFSHYTSSINPNRFARSVTAAEAYSEP